MAIIRVFPIVKPPKVSRSSGGRPASEASLRPLQPEPWRKFAACLGHDPEDWFPEPGDDPRRTADAQRVCRTECPVQTECLLYALARNERHGIWGGMTPRQRTRMVKEARARRTAAGDVA
jgi:hypothetical protein